MVVWRQAGEFASIEGPASVAQVIGDAWDVYASGRSGSDLAHTIATDTVHARRYFVNDNYCWQYTDSQCNFHATYGWRPFFDPAFRVVDHNTWVRFFECQVDADLRELFLSQSSARKAPPIGFFPFSMYPQREAREALSFFYANSFKPGDEAHVRHDEQIDFQLLNVITAADWVLLERDMGAAERILRQVELFMDPIEHRMDSDGLLLVGPQGSQIEFGHGGWRYPSSTFAYLWSMCDRMSEVAGMLEAEHQSGGDDQRHGGSAASARWEERAKRLASRLGEFLQEGKWFAGALDASREKRMGTGVLGPDESSYFETYPNLNAVVLGVADGSLSASILDRVDEIPELAENGLVLCNYPQRPPREMDSDHGGFPPPGTHVNGGAWWMLASSMLYCRSALRRSDSCDYLAKLLRLLHSHLAFDYYNEWGRNPASQYVADGDGSPDHFSVGSAGSVGMFFRGMLRIVPDRHGIRVSPCLPRGIRRMQVRVPVNYGGKRIYLDIHDRDGPDADRPSCGGVFLPFRGLPEESTVTIPQGELRKGGGLAG